MIRTFNARLGLVQAGAGGSAGAFKFDSTGLSADPALAYYLQDLTPAQLQNALDGGDPLPGLIEVNNALINGTGLTCGTVASGDPNCNGGAAPGGIFGSMPTWVWIAAAAGLAAFVVVKR